MTRKEMQQQAKDRAEIFSLKARIRAMEHENIKLCRFPNGGKSNIIKGLNAKVYPDIEVTGLHP